MWVIDQMTPGNPAYGLPIGYRLRGLLNVTALEKSFNEIIKRHESLRTTFAIEDGEPLQRIHPELAIRIAVTDLSHLTGEGREERLHALATQESVTSFDLSRLPLVRLSLFRLGDAEHVLLINLHHIVADGLSTGRLLGEVDTFYGAFTAGSDPHPPDLAIQYADFALWQRQTMANEAAHSTQIEFWRQRLSGNLPVVALPADRPRPAFQSFKGSNVFFDIPAALAQDLRSLGAREGCTFFMTVLAAFQVLLHRYSGAEDIVIGTPVGARTLRELEPLIGNFLNMAALRCDLSGNPSIIELLRRTRETTLDAFSNTDLPFEAMLKHLKCERDPGRNPIFQILLQVLSTPPPSIGELDVSSFRFDPGYAQFDLSLLLYEDAGGYWGRFEYCTDLFDSETVERLSANFSHLLQAIVTNPDEGVATLPILTDAERRQVLVGWNSTATPRRQDECLHQLIERQAGQTPDRTAVVFEQQTLTYRDLNRRANQLAHYLQDHGVGPDVPVGLFVERSLDMLVGIVGILKAGGAYVPIDPGYPKERVGYILEDSAAPIVLTQAALIDELPSFAGQSIRLDADWTDIAHKSADNPAARATPGHLAYVLFTSGSTGRPKGVALEHRSAVTFVQWAQWVFTPPELAAVLFSTSICFDLSVFEIFVTLNAGGKIVLARNALHLPTLPARNDVTLINTVPSAIAELLRMDAVPTSVRTVNLAGEALTDTLVEQIYASTAVDRVYNLYGPTEATTYSTYTVAHRGCPVTIGRPIADTQAYILDSRRNPVPIGVVGELHLAGGGLARGYYGRPELTDERFVPNPFSGERAGRMYSTGDLCRWLPDGNIQYVGRMDHQVKLRGFRIELGEIEATLVRHPAVRQSIVAVRDDEPGLKQLVAYVVLESGAVLTTRELRQHVTERLPDFMAPSAFVQLDALPLSPNGKIDRSALPAPDWPAGLETRFVEPQTPHEKILADIWSQVLRIERVSVHDKFFELGGDSILSIQVIARANQAGLRMTVQQMFQHQTIAELAMVAETTPRFASDNRPVTGEVPFTPIQHWFFERDFADPHHWNQAAMLELRQNVEPAVVEQAVRQLVMHHDALRLRFCRQAEGWTQVNAAADETVSLRRLDFSTLSEAEQNSAMQQSSTQLQARLGLAEGPLLQAALFDLGPRRRRRLLIVIHHLAVDGVSWRILLEDLQTACDQLGRGDTIRLPPKTSSFKSWAERLNEHARTTMVQREADYWLAASPADLTALPVDFAHGSNSEASVRVVTMTLDAETTRALLQRVPHAYNTQINDVLLSALGLALSLWQGRSAVAIDVEGHGREDLLDDMDLSRTVGWFTSVFPLRLDLRASSRPGDLLKSVKEQLRRVPHRGIGYGLLKYLGGDSKAASQVRAMPQPQVLFNYLGQFDLPATASFAWVWESTGPLHSPRAHRSHLLEINSWVADDQLRVDWSFSENVHRLDTIDGLAEGFLEELRKLIRHCTLPDARGYTPSDFADAGLNQTDLDRLIADLG